MQPNWDPDVKKFLLKVLNSISLVLLWMMACATAGIYFELGYTNGKPLIYTILFYAGDADYSCSYLIRYLYNTWKSS